MFLGSQKNTFGKFRKFSKISAKKFFKIPLWDLAPSILELVSAAKMAQARGLEHPKSTDWPKNRFFQSSRYRYPNPTTEKETSN